MIVLGQLVLVASFAAAAFSAYLYFRTATGNTRRHGPARAFLILHSLLLGSASLLLLVSLLRHDYSIGYVYSYSDTALPLHFLVSSFYAGQEGSFLFWALCSAVLALVLRAHAKKQGNEQWVMAIFMSVQAMLAALVVLKTPFRSIWEMFPQLPAHQLPQDGRGLNPLLQNFWMVIHPPVLFIGFAAMAAPFSLAIAGLWKRDYAILTRQGFPWVLFSTSVLGLGIMLGAYWAYGVLGWGGYWGWDPVENSSLVPWLVGLALLHTMLAQRRTSKYVRTNFALAVAAYFLVMYSTFLTRSGILGDASVHSFTDPGAVAYWTLLVILLAVAAAGLTMFSLRFRELRPERVDAGLLTRETSLGAGAIALILSAAVVLFGTSLPILSWTRVEGAFYDMANLPLVIGMVFLLGFSLSMQWGLSDVGMTWRRSWKPLCGSVLAGVAAWGFGARDAWAIALIVGAFFAVAVNVDAAAKIVRGDPMFLGGKIAHIGIAVFLLGVICSGKFAVSERVALPLNAPREAAGYTLTYLGYQPLADGKYAFQVRSEKDGHASFLSPIMFETNDQGLMRNPDIASFLTRDFYLSPLSLEQPESPQTAAGETFTLKKGETVSMGDVKATFVQFEIGSHRLNANAGGQGGMAVGSVLQLTQGQERETVVPTTVYRAGAQPEYQPSVSRLMNATLQLVTVNVGGGERPSSVTIGIRRPGTQAAEPETLVVEASVKPFIGLVWAGTIVMMGGFVLSFVKRSKES